MKYIEGENREQEILFPEAIGDYVGEDNPVKFIDSFVDNLDLKGLGFKYSVLKETGRPPYNPGDMLKLYIYGYINRIRSSRRLEKEAIRNVEAMWLLRKLRPDFKTIADFRRDNTKGIKGVCKEFTALCKGLDLFGGELVAIDGSKFRAVNSKKRNFNEKKLRRSIREIEEKIDRYFEELDENDRLEEGIKKPSEEDIRAAIERLKERKGKYKSLLSELKRNKEKQISLTDSDSKAMVNNGKKEICYNIQAAVDSKHKLILDHKVTNDINDRNQLSDMSGRAKEVLGVERLEVLADKGYYNWDEIKGCESNKGIEVYVPEVRSCGETKRRGRGKYGREHFKYDSSRDVYICPGKRELGYKRSLKRLKKIMKVYARDKCRSCKLRARCPQMVLRWEHEEILERVRERVKNNREKVKKRQWLSEHPFGTMKRTMNQGYMLMKGLEKVGAEFSFTVLAYNMKRAMNIIGAKNLIKEIRIGFTNFSDSLLILRKNIFKNLFGYFFNYQLCL